MKRAILALALIASATGIAEAKCSKSNLNGNWVVFPISGAAGLPVTISNGQFTYSGTPFNISSFGSNCRGTGTFGTGASIGSVIVASEDIKSTSSAKPNMLVININAGPIVQVFQAFRR